MVYKHLGIDEHNLSTGYPQSLSLDVRDLQGFAELCTLKTALYY